MPDIKPMQMPGFELRDFDDETLLVRGEDIHVLNATAALVWKLCDGRHTIPDMAETLRREFNVPPERDLGADIETVLQELREKKLITDPLPEEDKPPS